MADDISHSAKDLRIAINSAISIRDKAIEGRIVAKPPTPLCKICLDTEGPFISPCDCRGTQEFVHAECLVQWRSRHNPASPQFNNCMDCGSEYWNVEPLVMTRYGGHAMDEFEYESPASFINGLRVLCVLLTCTADSIWLILVFIVPISVVFGDEDFDPANVNMALGCANALMPLYLPSLRMSKKRATPWHFGFSFLLLTSAISTIFVNSYSYSMIVGLISIFLPFIIFTVEISVPT